MLTYAVAFLGVLIGTLTDLKKREVPDWVNYSLIAAGLGFAVIAAASTQRWLGLAESLAGLVACFVLGALMYYTGQWGGGDAKLIMGFGALFGLPLTTAGWSAPPFLVVFLVATLFSGAVYGLLWMLSLMVIRRKDFVPAFAKRMHDPALLRLRKLVIGFAIILLVAGFVFPGPGTIVLLVLAAMIYLLFYLSIAVKVVESVCFVKEVPIGKLVEGDWIVGEVRKDGKVLVPEKNPGLTKKQLAALEKHKVKSVTVKEGIPFVPSFLIAFVVAYALMPLLTSWPLLPI